MSATDETTVDVASLRALQDRTDIADVLYRYSSAVDSFDNAGVRSALADDIWAHYGNGDPVEGGDKLADWIAEATATVIWQHHLLNVYHVNIDGDQARRSPTSPPTRCSRRTRTPRSSSWRAITMS